jgi:hypothetical protein
MSPHVDEVEADVPSMNGKAAVKAPTISARDSMGEV